MNEVTKGLFGMYSWFVKEPLRLRSLGSIDLRCRNLLTMTKQLIDIYEARIRFFLPLLRCGVIDFYGGGQFGLAPSCAIKGSSKLLVINGHQSLHQELETEYDPTFPGISCSNYHPRQLQVLLKHHIPSYTFSLPESWRQIPHPAAIVRQWRPIEIDDQSGFEYFDHQWKAVNGSNAAGIYRRSANAYAERYYRSKTNNWNIIPDRVQNVDAFNQAVLLERIQNKRTLQITYRVNVNELQIKEKHFPIVPERLLMLHTLLHQRINNPLERIYHVGNNMIKTIHQYTANLIQYAE